jgi:hypothetical protein
MSTDMRTDPLIASKLALAQKYNEAREMASAAFAINDGAVCTGQAMHATQLATLFKSTYGHTTTDAAVAEMRQLLRLTP